MARMFQLLDMAHFSFRLTQLVLETASLLRSKQATGTLIQLQRMAMKRKLERLLNQAAFLEATSSLQPSCKILIFIKTFLQGY